MVSDAPARPAARPVARFAPREVDLQYRSDGSILMRSPIPAGTVHRHLCEYLEHWADAAADRTYLAERDAAGEWRRLSYGEAWRAALAIGQNLLGHGLGPDTPLAILTANSIEHALVTLGAMIAGVPAAPISPAYSTGSGPLERLTQVIDLLKPGMVFAQSADALMQARNLPGLADLPWVSVEPSQTALPFGLLEQAPDVTDAINTYRAADSDTVAKILFTSGSTGAPKGVPNTHRMICASCHAQGLLFFSDTPSVTIDWLPWHHTLAGNSTIGAILREGGTLYIDDGRPLPGLFDKTIRNLKDVSPTFVSNVPAALQMLVEAMEADDDLCERFFARLERMSFAGASLSPETFVRMQALAVQTTGQPIPFISGYGTTETAPGIAATHWASEGKGELGLPAPGCDIKLVPIEDRYDLRVRGNNVFAGYLGRPDLTAAAFDDEGFYRVGDAVQFVDPTDPSQGLRFAGRLSENFKLSNGSWVQTGDLRAAVIAAAGDIAEIVLAGHDRNDIRLLIWLTAAATGDVAACQRIASDIAQYNAVNKTATRRIAAFLIMSEPPSMAAGELTDKAYVNQRAVLTNRSAEVAKLYSGAKDIVIC